MILFLALGDAMLAKIAIRTQTPSPESSLPTKFLQPTQSQGIVHVAPTAAAHQNNAEITLGRTVKVTSVWPSGRIRSSDSARCWGTKSNANRLTLAGSTFSKSTQPGNDHSSFHHRENLPPEQSPGTAIWARIVGFTVKVKHVITSSAALSIRN